MARVSEMKRKLVAILAGDVAGYDRLVAENEELAVQNWKAYRAYVGDAVDDHQGRRFDGGGNGMVFAFGSVLDALRCAVDVQQFLRDVNETVSPERRMLMRFGLHLSEVAVDRGAYRGDGVAVAAGLEALAAPGGICVSDMVYGNVAASPEFAFAALGEVKPNDGAPPMRAYRVELNGADHASAALTSEQAPADEAGEQASVAVLPFINLGHDPRDDYFVDGLSEDIITGLAAWRSFPVIARNSTFAYKGKSPDVRAVARDLGARYVLEGSVRMVDQQVRVNVQFVDAARGRLLWAETFEREADDVFALQDEIGQHIAATIAPEVERAERDRVTRARPTDMTAWRYCLKGRALMETFTAADNAEARTMFEQAIARDPGYSGGYTGLAYSYHREIWFETAPNRGQAIAAQLKAARQAVSLDQANAEAHCVLGFGLIWDRQFHLAIAAGEEAVHLNPSNALAYAQLGMAQSFAGRPQEGIINLERSLRLNPQDPRIHFVITMLARAHLNARAPEAAARWSEAAVQRRADYPLGHLVGAASLGHLGRSAEARAALDECERLDPGFARRWALRPMYKNPADDLYFLDGLRAAGLDAAAELG